MHENGLAYHFFEWKQAIENAYGFHSPYFILEQDKKVCGIFPTSHIHTPFFKDQLVSLPYCDIGGILADSPEVEKSLFEYVCQFSRKNKIQKLEIRAAGNQFNLQKPDQSEIIEPTNAQLVLQKPNEFPAKKVRMILNLPGNSSLLLAAFKSKLRSQVNKPGRDGLTARLGGTELLNNFYSVYAENMRDLGSPAHSKGWFHYILKHFGTKAKCGIVYMPDKTPAAAGIILFHDRTVSIPWASSRRRFNRFNPNMLLYWTFLKFAADSRYKFFDFGRSTPGEGTYKFKKQWGTRSHSLQWETWKIKKRGPHHISSDINQNLDGRVRIMAERIIQMTPLALATFFGSRLRKYISL